MKTETLFSTLVSSGRLLNAKAFNRELLKEIPKVRTQDRMGRAWSEAHYRGGYTSYGSLSDLNHRWPIFARLETDLQPTAEAFAKRLGWEMRGLTLKMTALWVNLMAKGTYHPLHHHPHSVLSGTYYVQAPLGSSPLKIEDPRMASYMNAPLRREPLYHYVPPTPGTFVLFESWIRHEVPPNFSQTPRISLSFNYSAEAEE